MDSYGLEKSSIGAALRFVVTQIKSVFVYGFLDSATTFIANYH